MKDFSFQGKVYLGTRLAGGRAGPLTWVGDVPKLDVSLSVEKEKRKESFSGNRMTSAVLQKGKESTIAGTLNWANSDNLALGFYGTKLSVVSGTVTAEPLPSALEVGNSVVLDHGGVSALVLSDSTATPVVLVEGTHYRLDSANGGVLEILSLTSLTQPLKAAYAYTASNDVTMFTATAPERYLFLDGTNTVDNSPVRARLYRVQLDPFATLPLINEGFGELPFTGEVLFDEEAEQDSELGGFGKIELPTAVA